jgi:hypothetical protein
MIMGDEYWVYGCNPETRTQSSQWKTPTSPTMKKAWQSSSHVKVILITFFNMKRTALSKFVP